jgi:hypothetical protein
VVLLLVFLFPCSLELFDPPRGGYSASLLEFVGSLAPRSGPGASAEKITQDQSALSIAKKIDHHFATCFA